MFQSTGLARGAPSQAEHLNLATGRYENILVRKTIINERNAFAVALAWQRRPSLILNGMYCARVFFFFFKNG